MNDALKMQISAFVDGELPENESELLLRRLSQDVALRQQVSNYLQIGRLVRQESEVRGMESLRGRIAAALGESADEPVVAIPETRSKYTRLLAGAAIAASVAMLALFGLQQTGTDVVPGIAGESVADTRAAEEFSTVPDAEDVLGDRILDEMRRHHAGASEASSGSLLTRAVTLEVREDELNIVEPVSRPLDEDAEDAEDDADSVLTDDSNESLTTE